MTKAYKMQDHRTFFGTVLTTLGLGVGGLVGTILGQIATIVKTFGDVGIICGAIASAISVMILGYKFFKILNRIEASSIFTVEQLMKDEPGTLRYDIRENKEYIEEMKKNAEEAKMIAGQINERGDRNEKKLDRVLGHSKAHIQQMAVNQEIEKEIKKKVDETAEIIEKVADKK